MKVINIDSAHAEKVLSGDKYSAIQQSKRCAVGDKVKLCSTRQNKKRILGEGEIQYIFPILITTNKVLFKEKIPFVSFENFLEMEGFDELNKETFIDYYKQKYGLPFQGYVHIWQKFKRLDENFLKPFCPSNF
jgi:hypothetical protein